MPILGWDMPKHLLANQLGIGEFVPSIAYSWYIEGPEKKILIDTSCRSSLLRFASKQDLVTPEDKLQEFGLKPSDIDIVIMTQLHYEHIGYGTKYSNATFYVQKEEYEACVNPHPSYTWIYDKRLLEGLKIELIEGDQEIVKGVRTMYTPGHSPGCQSVMVETDKGLAGITGFCCGNVNFYPPVPMGVQENIICCGMYVNLYECYDNMKKFRNAVDILIPNHDAEHARKDRIPELNTIYTPYHKVR